MAFAILPFEPFVLKRCCGALACTEAFLLVWDQLYSSCRPSDVVRSIAPTAQELSCASCHFPCGSMVVCLTIPVCVCAIVSWLARAFFCLRRIVQAGDCKAIHSGATSSLDLRQIENAGFAALPRCGRRTVRPCRWFAAILVGPAGVQYRKLSKAYQTCAVVLRCACAPRKGCQ